MRKSKIFLIVGIALILISIIMFLTLKKELVNPNCVPKCEITKFTQVFSFNTICPLICISNTNNQDYVTHSFIFKPFFWLGIISLIISLILFFVNRNKI